MADEDAEVFEITDFTTASDWERFIAQLEEVIHEWRLTSAGNLKPLEKQELSNGQWKEQTEKIEFADFPFVITHHFMKSKELVEEQKDGNDKDAVEDSNNEDQVPMVHQDMMSMENDFPPRAHCLSRWYGLRSFLVISPGSDGDSIIGESKSSLLKSSICIAINNTGCQVPVFIQAHQKWRKLYFGLCEFPGVRTHFEMVHFKRAPRQYNHLAGLLDVFKGKVASQLFPAPPVNVSIRFTYVLNDWTQHAWPQAPPDMNSSIDEDIGYTDFGTIPFGACEDPVSELHLSTTWPNVSEEMIVDSDVYSDLDPLQAPHWSVRVHMTADPQCLLAEHLLEYLELCRRHESTNQLLGKSIIASTDDKESADISQALQRLTEPQVSYHIPSSISKAVSHTRQSLNLKPGEAPIPEDLLNKLLIFLFPDAGDHSDKTEPNQEDVSTADTGESSEVSSDAKNEKQELWRQLKSAPHDSLTSRLAIVCCVVNHSHGGLHAVAHLWQEFVLEMRYRWENNYNIPELEKGSPNMGCCLLHQKLQMLNCCVERKKARESMQAGMSASSSLPTFSASSSVSDFVNPISQNVSSNSDKMDISDTQNTSERTLSIKKKKSESSRRPASVGKVPENISRQRPQSPSESSSDEEFFECEEKDDEVIAEGKENLEEMEKTSVSVKVKDSKLVQKDVNEDDSEKTGLKLNKNYQEVIETNQTEQTSEQADKITQECMEAEDSNTAFESINAGNSQDYQRDSLHQPEGRLRPYGSTRLLNVDEALYIPVTQEPAPMTEDLLEEHAEVLAKLGTDAEGAHLRARMQSACLLSDMESFKAANPGYTLEDFVRWYSPRDYIEEEMTLEDGSILKTGHLSTRMQIPGNMWVEVWQSARPVPARRQKRLFDDTKEAERVLHFLAGLKPGELAKHLLPMVIQAGISSIIEHEENMLQSVQTHIKQLILKASNITRSPVVELKKYEDLVNQIELAETVIARAKSLEAKFDSKSCKPGNTHELERFVSSLLEQPEVPVLGASRGPAGQLIHELFTSAQKNLFSLDEEVTGENITNIPDFPDPAGREFILRTIVPRPAPFSRPSPQRMYCVLTGSEFRLAGSFSEDTTFR